MSLAGRLTRGVAIVAPRLSFTWASRIGRALGACAWAVDARHRRVAAKNLAIAFPELPRAKRRALGRRAFQQAGRTAMETLWSPALVSTQLQQIATFEGLEHLEQALAPGRGALLATAHFGNWELMGVALAQLGIPLHVIARKIADPEVEEVLRGLRSRTGARVIYKDEAVRSALRALRTGDAVGVLIDQNTIPSQATFVPFFGRPAATTRVLAQLHLRTGAPIVLFFSVPEESGYRFVIEPLRPELGEMSADARVDQLTAAATARIEDHVRRSPEAWLWIHDRWRNRPPPEARKTADERTAARRGAVGSE